MCGHNKVVVILVLREVDIEARDGDIFFGSKTALQLSAEGGHLRVVNTLVIRGALAEPETFGRLRFSVEEGFRAAFDTLFEGNREGKYELPGGFLQCALILAAEYGDLPVVEALSIKGVNLDGTAEFWDPGNNGWFCEPATALHAAAYGGHYDVVNYLLENRVRIETVDGELSTPLSYSVMEKPPACDGYPPESRGRHSKRRQSELNTWDSL
ncbi:EsV-1-21 [Ectocarpus siliculosus]|uniref:EsV-1-21 n=1 Tax=Ectocarpus siliculosus TaxID=2880 RepID=D7G1E2_ECTSI|nr:EsV-1-21 [Ectocarpus siliculosus]|eukprot:CBJ33252.1 EsV-1-21 [Ectocarpus siliculosus]